MGTFQFNVNGGKGIDFIYYPEHDKMKITVCYSSYVVTTVITRLIQLKLLHSLDQPNVYLQDDALQILQILLNR